MKNTRLNNFRLLGLVVSCVIALSACADSTTSEADLFSQRTTNAFDPATIDAIGDKVADWQLANLDDFSYIRSNRTDSAGIARAMVSVADRRGWQHGALYVGMMNWATLPGNEKYDLALREISEENQWQLGSRLFHGDDHIVGQLYLYFYEQEKDPGMIAHTIRQFNQIRVADPDGSLEFVDPRIRGVGRACQLRWCWSDALFMSPPTWMKLSLATGDDRYVEYADKEFWATHDYLRDPETSLFFRDSRYFERRDEAGNKIFWSRGSGWVYAGLVNILRILPQAHPSYSRYVKLYKDMSATIAGLQHDNGLWSASLLSKDANPTPETSGSSFMTYGLAWGLNNGHLDSAAYGPVVRRGWLALVNAVSDDGKLGWVQPVGADPDNILENDSGLYGVGGFLLAASQMFVAK